MSVGKRISVVLSILWALLIISIANSNYKFDWNLVLFGLVALVFFWGGTGSISELNQAIIMRY